MRRLWFALLAPLLIVFSVYEREPIRAYADGYIPPVIAYASGVISALQTAVSTLGGFTVNNGSWVDPLADGTASGKNTTGLGSAGSGQTALALEQPLNFVAGMGVQVKGAGVSAADLNTTVSAYSYTPKTSTGTISLGTPTTVTTTTAGWVVGMGIVIPGALNGNNNLFTTVTVVGGSTLTIAQAATAAVTSIPVFSTPTITLAAATSTAVQGVVVRTIGTMSTGTPTTLTVASTAGWAPGYGISVGGAGAAGATLVTSVSAVASSTTLTLATGASTNSTNGAVNFDDGAAIAAELATGKNVNLGVGQFNIADNNTGLTIALPQWVQCSGAAVGVIPTAFVGWGGPLAGTVIWNRGTTDVDVNITSQQASLKDCLIQQAVDVTPTTGNIGLQVGTGSTTLINGGNIERNTIYNTFQIFSVNQGVYAWNISYNSFFGGPLTSTMVTYDNPAPGGDNKIVGNSFIDEEATPRMVCVTFTAADTQNWAHNKFDNCTSILSSSSSGVNNQTFVDNSFENFTTSAASISAGTYWAFTGDQFNSVNGSNPAIALSGSVDFVTITGNIVVTNGLFSNSSSGTHFNISGNTDNAAIATSLSETTPAFYVLPSGGHTAACIGVGPTTAVAPCASTGLDSIFVGGDGNEVISVVNSSGNSQAVQVGVSFGNIVAGFGMVSGGSLQWDSDSSNIGAGSRDTMLTRPAAGTVSTDTTTAGNGLGQFKAAAFVSSGAAPVGTTGSCVASTFVGGSSAGTFHAAVCAAGTIILSSLPTAPHGWSCDAHDQTTSADALVQTANSTTSVTFKATAVAADVVSFQCQSF